jgi:hypothetical protein
LLEVNPYFQSDLAEVRKLLNIPPRGFKEAVTELVKDIPRHNTEVLSGKPDLAKLRIDAEMLGLPWESRLKEWRAECARRGLDFDDLVEDGWGVLPITSYLEWGQWWVDWERKQAGLIPVPRVITLRQEAGLGTALEPKLPSAQAALELAGKYRLGDDYLFDILSMILGIPMGGGEADIELVHRDDWAGVMVTLNCVEYKCTKSEWAKIFDDVIQPSLLAHLGKLSSEIPYPEALADARKRARRGRPPYSPETLNQHLRMWEFCYRKSYLRHGASNAALQAFLENLPEQERSEYEKMDQETFRRAVKNIEGLMHPT